MLTDELLEQYGGQYVKLFQQLEARVINDIARRVRKESRWTETAELQAQFMRDLGYSPARIRAEVLRQLRADKKYMAMLDLNTLEAKDLIRKAVRNAKKGIKAANVGFLTEVANTAFRYDLSLWTQAGKELPETPLNQIIRAYAAQSEAELLDLTRSLGFIIPGEPGYVPARDAFQTTMNSAINEVVSGTFSATGATENAIHNLAKSGLRKVDYASGRSWSLDTASRMVVRTACAQITGRISEDNIRKTGVEYVEVSSHWGARPSHAEWQGRVYTLKEFEKVCGYGDPHNPDHIYSYNCRHTHYPYWPGISKPTQYPKEPAPTEYNGKQYTYYQAQQQQRRMEREIRALKRERNAGGDVPDSKIKDRVKKYNDFSDTTGMKRRPDLLRVLDD